MDIYPDTLAFARWDVTCDLDLTDATSVQILLGDAWVDLAWTGAATHVGSTFKRTAQLEIGGAEAGSGTQVSDGWPKRPLVKVDIGGQALIAASSASFSIK